MNRDALWGRAMSICSPGCHQRSDRSFFLGRYQAPVCARCCGVLLGQTAGICLIASELPVPPVGSCLVAMAVMATDWGIQEIGWVESTNWRRLVTGALAGAGMVNLVWILLAALILV